MNEKNIKIGDYVTRKKYGNDIIFKVYKIESDTVYLKGEQIRLLADSTLEDITPIKNIKKK